MSTIDTSGIDATQPPHGNPTTEGVRDNFAEIINQLNNAAADINIGLTLDPVLAGMEGVTIEGDEIHYALETNLYFTTPLTAFGRSLIDDADAAAARVTLGLDGLNYTEGTWSPVLSDGTNDATMGGSTIGEYTKIGRMVQVKGTVIVTAIGSVSGNIRITGLPFTASNTANSDSAISVGNAGGLNITAGYNVTGIIVANMSYVQLRLWDATTGTTTMQATEWPSGGSIQFSATYYV